MRRAPRLTDRALAARRALTSPPPGPGWIALARLIRAERAAAGWLASDSLAAAAGLSLPTVHKLETGRRVSDRSLRKVDAALGWPAGAAERVAAGGTLHSAADHDRYTSDACEHGECPECAGACGFCGARCLCLTCDHPPRGGLA